MPITTHDKPKDIHDFLKNHKVGVLSTVDPNGDPHGAAIYFTVNENLEARFVTKTRTKKADNLRHNNHAMLVVYEAQSQSTAQILGEVEEITDETEMNDVFAEIVDASLKTSNTAVPPISKLVRGEYVIYRLVPKQVRMAVFNQSEGGDYQDVFKMIEPN